MLIRMMSFLLRYTFSSRVDEICFIAMTTNEFYILRYTFSSRVDKRCFIAMTTNEYLYFPNDDQYLLCMIRYTFSRRFDEMCKKTAL